MRKICVVITARPSYSRIKTALTAIEKHPELELQLVITGSALLEKYGSVITQIENDGFRVANRLFNVLEGNSPAVAVKTTGLALLELSTIFEQMKPDAVVTIADRFETMSTAVSASYMNIPLVHIQGGEVTGNIDEKVRHAITQLSDIHFVSSENARQKVIQMGKNADSVFNTGCPSIDMAIDIQENSALDFDLYEYDDFGLKLDLSHGYVIVMQHPVTTEYQFSKSQIECTIKAIERLALPAFWFLPNPDPGTEEIAKEIINAKDKKKLSAIRFFSNMEPRQFLRLLKNSSCLVGNSSVGIRECSFLGIPVVNIGNRQSGRERGRNVIDVDYDSDAIYEAIKFQIDHGSYPQDSIYGNGNSGEKIAALLASVSLSIN